MSKKVIIAHRGNLNGPNPADENRPDYLLATIAAGFDVEVDVWGVGDKLFAGHDEPQYELDQETIGKLNNRAWFHAKNVDALFRLILLRAKHFFWHQNDDLAMTSCGKLWTLAGKELSPLSIAVMPENAPEWDLSLAYGICTDCALRYTLAGSPIQS